MRKGGPRLAGALVLLRWFFALLRRIHHYFAKIVIGRTTTFAPLVGVPKRNLLEPDAVAILCRSNMQVPRYDDGGIETKMPIFGSASPAPDGESRDARQLREALTQGKMIDQHCGKVAGLARQAHLGQVATRMTPLRNPRIRVRVHKQLIGAHDAAFPRPFHSLLERNIRWPEAIVVQQEQRRDSYLGSTERYDRIRIFGGQHVVRPAQVDQFLVSELTARFLADGRYRPQFVITGDPDQLPEPRTQRFERESQVRACFADVARQDQPIVATIADRRERAPIDLVAQMQITQREEPHASFLPLQAIGGRTERPARAVDQVAITERAAGALALSARRPSPLGSRPDASRPLSGHGSI